jgi:hypothetical protein
MATDVNLGMLTLEELRQLLGSGQQSTPYSRIMGQSGGGDPYSQIMAQMPVLQNPYANSYYGPTGGYIPRMPSNAATSGMTGRANFGGGGGSSGSGSDPTSNPFGDLTPTERAAYYTENPNMGSVTRGLQGLLGFTSLGALSKAMNPGLWGGEGLISMGVNPDTYQAAKEGFRASEINAMNAEAQAAIDAAQNAQSMQSMQDALNADTSASQSISDQSSAGSSAGGYGTGDTSGGFGEGQYNMGGPVDRVGGPNPPGPDDGTGMLQLGEYVIKKSAVDKYGTGLLNMINNGKIPAKKMKSLLG